MANAIKNFNVLFSLSMRRVNLLIYYQSQIGKHNDTYELHRHRLQMTE